VHRLGAAGQSLADALGSLERDSSGVAAILDEAVQRMSVRKEIGRALTRAAAELSALAPDSRPQVTEIGPVARRFLDMLARSYTMVEERVVQDNVVRDFFPHVTDPPRTADTAPAAAPAVDDMLF
jgi:hypothetical protein